MGKDRHQIIRTVVQRLIILCILRQVFVRLLGFCGFDAMSRKRGCLIYLKKYRQYESLLRTPPSQLRCDVNFREP